MKSGMIEGTIAEKLDRVLWERIESDLDVYGGSILEHLLTPEECDTVTAMYADDAVFRSRVVMARHGFGRGEYKYFRYPLPDLVESLRTNLYPRLAPVANRWNQALRSDVRYPEGHAEFLVRCHDAGQRRPTPLLLQYGDGDYNCLHQDLYGEHVFPIQVAVLLSEPGRDFSGGDFVLTEQRPRMQSRVEVMPLRQGDAVAFAVHHRPVQGTRGTYRVNLRHGVSRVRGGHRHTLGIISMMRSRAATGSIGWSSVKMRGAGDFPAIAERVIGNDDGYPGCFRSADMCMPHGVAGLLRSEINRLLRGFRQVEIVRANGKCMRANATSGDAQNDVV